MTRDFKEALRHRRTYYHITDSSPISDEQIKEIIDFCLQLAIYPHRIAVRQES